MTVFIDKTVTLGATAFEYVFGTEAKFSLYVLNGTQNVTAVVTVFSQRGNQQTNVLTGQPYRDSVQGYKFTVSGNGAAVTIHADDTGATVGAVQAVSQARTLISHVNESWSAELQVKVPAGVFWELFFFRMDLTTSGTAGTREDVCRVLRGGNVPPGTYGEILADTGAQTGTTSLFPAGIGFTPNAGQYNAIKIANWQQINTPVILIAGDIIDLIVVTSVAGDTHAFWLNAWQEPL